MILLLAALARAQDPAPAESGWSADGQAELRLIGTLPDTFPLDDEGTTSGWGPAVDNRLRAGGTVKYAEVFRATAELDVLSGQVAGATWDLSALDQRGRDANDAFSLHGVVPRKAFVGARLPWFDLEVGLNTSSWGLGLIANDGATDPMFGRSDFGDRTLRARLATAPLARGGERFPLYVILAGDRVVADELGRMADGDVAWQGIFALLYADDRQLGGRTAPRRLGVYGVVRDQVGELGHLRVTVADATASWGFLLGDGPMLKLAAEGAVIHGLTDAALTYVAPVEVPVRQGGFVVQTSLSEDRWGVHLDAAYASGDSASDNGVVSDMRFDRDYAVGMVLFDEVMGAIDLVALDQATDPEVAANPPDGAETLAAEGAFHAAFALQPAVTARPIEPLEVRAGLVAAWSTSPIGQPVETFRNGGVPTNHVGRVTDGRFLGTEVDWAIGTSAEAVADWKVRPQLTVEGGHAFPSAQLSGAIGVVNHVLVLGRVRL